MAFAVLRDFSSRQLATRVLCSRLFYDFVKAGGVNVSFLLHLKRGDNPALACNGILEGRSFFICRALFKWRIIAVSGRSLEFIQNETLRCEGSAAALLPVATCSEAHSSLILSPHRHADGGLSSLLLSVAVPADAADPGCLHRRTQCFLVFGHSHTSWSSVEFSVPPAIDHEVGTDTN